jgi:hypothetical protein
MVVLIALLSSGKGSWTYVNNLISSNDWDFVYLVCNGFSFENFSISKKNVLKLKFDEKNIVEGFDSLSNFFKKEIKDFEVALNLMSGNGMEHMALTNAVLKAGLGLRFVYLENNEVKEFVLLEGSFEEE